MPFRSQAQAGWAFATWQPWAKRWARETGPYKKLPVKLKAPNYGAKRGQTIAGRLVRGEGGRFSSSGAASGRVPPKALPKAPKGRAAGGGKGRAAPKLAKPKVTPEQRAAEQAKKRQDAQAAKRAERDRILAEAGLGGADGLAGALIDARDGNTLTPANGQKLAEKGLAEQGRDGSYRLTPAGRQVVNAAERGDAGAVRDTMGRASDRAATQRERRGKKISAAMARATQQPKPVKVGGGGGSKKKPPVVRRVPARSSSRPQAARSGGGASGDTAKPALPANLVAAARALSTGQATDEDLLIRNGLAKRGKDGRVVLTAQGLRAIRTKDYTPTRTTDAGHTGVMVALYPDAAAAKAIASAEGVTEPIEGLHLTLCFLGDSSEQPLSTNKDKLIAAVEEWAQQHGQPMEGVINGLGRFFHSESDDTNAVYVAPDVPGLPEQRQSLAEWIEKSGFDYSQDHGFTPHITVAYVPENAPTPPIRVETPIRFNNVTLAWGDEQYAFPLGMRAKSFAVFKDARGTDRWIARTTTAFEDRDSEVISTKALEDSAASPDPRGPLRFWHMGRPDPLSNDAPWGPGVDLGWCDFAATHGRTLIESGTFKSEAIARAVAAKADQLELSPGFFHAPMEPDASGVFHHIRIFERSLVPKWAGRASNPYTGLVVEKAMDQKKLAALADLGIDAATIKELLAEVATTEKAAEAEGVRYKEQATDLSLVERFKAFLSGEQVPAEPVTKAEEPALDPIAALTARIEALTAEVATLKAGPTLVQTPNGFSNGVVEKIAPAEKAAPPAEVETQADEPMVAIEEDADMPVEDMSGGEMSADEFLAAIGAVLDAKLGPLVEALGITTKLDGHMGELKSLLSGFTTQKDDERAQLTARLDQAEAKVAELAGDAPRVGYRASQATDTTVNAILETLKDAPGGANPHPFADLANQLFPTIGARQ